MPLRIEFIISLLLAAVFGAIIGLEREIHHKPAGLRTNILICLGAALFTTVSLYMGGGENESATRIAAQVVTGVGFIGAGAIIREPRGVHGLTTAATIWLVASIGVACGAGLYLLAAFITALSIIILLGLEPLEDKIAKHAPAKKKHAGKSSDSKDSSDGDDQ